MYRESKGIQGTGKLEVSEFMYNRFNNKQRLNDLIHPS